MTRIVLGLLLLAAPAAAQNPVSIFQIGTGTVVSTTIPVSGTVAATQSGSWLVQGMVAHDAVYAGNPTPSGCYASAAAPSDVSADGDMVRMWCLRNGAQSVNITNSTLAATQSGTWTVQPGNTANTTAWLVTGTGGTFPVTGTFWQATQPISAVALPLPSGAATSALQTQPGVDIGDVTINNAAGAAAVNVQDGGNSITIDGSLTTVTTVTTVGAVTAITNALPAGANAIGKLAANSGVDIGDVDVFTPRKQFFGTAQTVISTAVDVGASNFSATTTTYDNTTDGTYPAAMYALAVVQLPDWGAAPVAGTVVDLYGVILDVDGASDETDVPSGTAAGGAHYFCSWVIAAVDALQRRACVIDVTGYTKIDFYIRNGTAQNLNNDGGTSTIVKITPLTSN